MKIPMCVLYMHVWVFLCVCFRFLERRSVYGVLNRLD